MRTPFLFLLGVVVELWCLMKKPVELVVWAFQHFGFIQWFFTCWTLIGAIVAWCRFTSQPLVFHVTLTVIGALLGVIVGAIVGLVVALIGDIIFRWVDHTVALGEKVWRK